MFRCGSESRIYGEKVAAYWVVSVGTLAIQYCFALFYVDFLAAFEASRAATAGVGGLCIGLLDLLGSLTGSAVARWGEGRTAFVGAVVSGCGLCLSSLATELWHLFLTYGLLLGAGHSLVLFSGVICINKWFDTRLASASALGNTGAGVGPFLMPFLWAALRRRVGWRGGLVVVGVADGLLLLGAASGLAPPPTPPGAPRASEPEPEPEPEPSKGPSDAVDLRALPEFRRQCATILLFGFGYWIPAVHLVRLALDQGHSEGASSSLLVFVGIGALSVRVPVASLADACGRSKVFSGGLLLYALAQCLIFWLQTSYVLLAIFAAVVGGCIGSLLSLMPVLPMDIAAVNASHEATARATGRVCMWNGIGGVLGPTIAGALYDAYGSYVPGFLFGAAALAAASATLSNPWATR